MTKWWVNLPGSYGKYLFNCPDDLKSELLPDIEPLVYPADAPPVFFGHYWIEGDPAVMADNIVCLDYSVAKGGKLVAYRFNGEKKVSNENFVYV